MKIRIVLLGIVLATGLTFSANAQTDTTQVEERRKTIIPMGYVGVTYENTPVSPVRTNSFGIQTAVLIRNHWHLGAFATKHTSDNYQEQLIFPNYAQMNYKHGGIIIGYRTRLEKRFEFNLETKLGFGEAKWKHVDSGSAFLADKFRTLQLQISMDYLISNFLVGSPFVGYRTASDVQITGLADDDFNGMTYGFMVKLGRFK